MRVILSSGKVGHYYNLALTLQEAGYLKKFITTVYFRNLGSNSFWSKSMIKIFKNRVYNRFYEGIHTNLVKPIFYPEIFLRFLKLVSFIPDGFSTKIFNKVFDKASCKYVDKCDIFFAAVTYGLYSARKAKEAGSLVVLDMVSAHPKFYINTLKEESMRLQLPINIKDEYYLDKILSEFEIADYILVPSEFAKRTLTNEGIPLEKIRVIPYGVNVDTFSPKIRNDNRFRIICVGRITIGKGIHYLLKAYKELNLKNSELLLIGRDSPEVSNILKEYNGNFKQIPVVPHKFINDYYSNSSVFVLPSLVEGSALVVYEAMACGIPVIVTGNCGSVVRDGKDGFVIPIRDVEALKEKLLFFYENESSRLEMGESARKQAEAHSWKKYQEKLIRTLNEIVNLKETSFHANI